MSEMINSPSFPTEGITIMCSRCNANPAFRNWIENSDNQQCLQEESRKDLCSQCIQATVSSCNAPLESGESTQGLSSTLPSFDDQTRVGGTADALNSPHRQSTQLTTPLSDECSGNSRMDSYKQHDNTSQDQTTVQDTELTGSHQEEIVMNGTREIGGDDFSSSHSFQPQAIASSVGPYIQSDVHHHPIYPEIGGERGIIYQEPDQFMTNPVRSFTFDRCRSSCSPTALADHMNSLNMQDNDPVDINRDGFASSFPYVPESAATQSINPHMMPNVQASSLQFQQMYMPSGESVQTFPTDSYNPLFFPGAGGSVPRYPIYENDPYRLVHSSSLQHPLPSINTMYYNHLLHTSAIPPQLPNYASAYSDQPLNAAAISDPQQMFMHNNRFNQLSYPLSSVGSDPNMLNPVSSTAYNVYPSSTATIYPQETIIDSYHIMPLLYKSISIHKDITYCSSLDQQIGLLSSNGGLAYGKTKISPSFVDTTNDDMILINEFAGESVFLCNVDLDVVRVYSDFKRLKNLFVIKATNQFICSDWHRVTVKDIETANTIWSMSDPHQNPWGTCVLSDSVHQVAVCYPSNGNVSIYDLRINHQSTNGLSSCDDPGVIKPVSQWTGFASSSSFEWTKDRLLPYTISPRGTIVAGTGSGTGCLINCDIRSGRPTEVLTSLNVWIDLQRRKHFESSSCNLMSLPESQREALKLSCRMNDIAEDRYGTVVVPDSDNKRLIVKDIDNNVHIISDPHVMAMPCGVAIMRDGSLIVCDGGRKTLLTCHM